MSIGPVELLAIKFPGNQFKGEMIPALRQLVENNTIRILDIAMAIKDEDGHVDIIEINDPSDDQYAIFNPVVADITELISDNDMEQISAMLENNSSAAVMLFENTWATRFRDAVLNANGEWLFNIRIPKDVIEDSLAQAEELEAAGT